MMKLKDKILEVILNNKYFRNLIMEDTEPVILEPIPGLYDANDNLLCKWENSGIDTTKGYSASIVESSQPTSAFVRIKNYYPTTTKIILPEGITRIAGACFNRCSTLTTIVIPSTVTYIGQIAFDDCTQLTEVVFKNPKNWLGGRGTPIEESKLSDPIQAAEYLKSGVLDNFNMWK